jgi:hypothetical protein
VRALLAHPDAATDERAWRALLADDDARFATGASSETEVAAAPAWLRIPPRVEEHSTPRR